MKNGKRIMSEKLLNLFNSDSVKPPFRIFIKKPYVTHFSLFKIVILKRLISVLVIRIIRRFGGLRVLEKQDRSDRFGFQLFGHAFDVFQFYILSRLIIRVK